MGLPAPPVALLLLFGGCAASGDIKASPVHAAIRRSLYRHPSSDTQLSAEVTLLYEAQFAGSKCCLCAQTGASEHRCMLDAAHARCSSACSALSSGLAPVRNAHNWATKFHNVTCDDIRTSSLSLSAASAAVHEPCAQMLLRTAGDVDARSSPAADTVLLPTEAAADKAHATQTLARQVHNRTVEMMDRAPAWYNKSVDMSSTLIVSHAPLAAFQSMVSELSLGQCLSSNLFLRYEHRDTRLDSECSEVLARHMKSVGVLGVLALTDVLKDELDEAAGAVLMQKWAHRAGQLAGRAALEHGKPLWAIEAVALHELNHHPLHGAMWELVVQSGSLDGAWGMQKKLCSWIQPHDYHMWIDCGHGIGHAIAYWAPRGTMTPALSATQAVSVCRQEPYDEFRVQAACADGIFHESFESDMLQNWGLRNGKVTQTSAARSTSGILAATAANERAPIDETALLASCAELESHAFYCYSWQGFLDTDRCLTEMPTATTPVRKLAGCMASAGIRLSADTLAEGAMLSCAPLRNTSYSLWLACHYGPTSKLSIGFGADGAWAPKYRAYTWNETVVPECAGYDDEFARLLCQNEIWDEFSVASVLMDNTTFLEAAIALPTDEVLAGTSARVAPVVAMRAEAMAGLRRNLQRLAKVRD